MATSLAALVLGLAFAVTARAQATAGPMPSQTAPAATAPAPDGDGVILIGGAATRDAFAKGRPLIETAAYKVHASRRDAPGGAEVHGRDTDIFYVLDGTATLVTGGRTIDARTTRPDEVRGSGIDGGTARPLAKGDVVIVPSGVPHWFRDVQAPFLYYTVKVTGPAPTAGGGR
jgi:mannose-6-phosphate isomerase-like protein (cupin superfamily)